ELLKEYKQAVIAKAVTQGINPKAKMKNSGITWIGQIPEHWGVTRNKTFLLEKDDVVGKSNDYQLLSLTKGGVIIRDVESGKGKFPKDFESYKIVHSDDVIFCLFDVDETPRTVGLSKYNGMITGAYDIFQLQNINSEFYTYYFIAIDDRKALRPLYTGLRKVVKKDRFLSYKIAVPPLPEQEQIVAYIKEKVDSIDAQIASVEKQIANLNEFKQSLISDAVTGKIKVA
ncbi:MAG: restriction endonuclease subunit S, partial [Bacteroidales bacterium]|nr:restriction endonuclease subunit S [Bacteroidales bacterium]